MAMSRTAAEDGGGKPALSVVVESPQPAEQRVWFRDRGSWCRSDDVELRSGARLNVTRGCFEPSFSLSASARPAEVELVVSKGIALLTRDARGRAQIRGGYALQIGRTRRAEAGPLSIAPVSPQGGSMECVSLSIGERRLCELLGATALPAPIRAVTASDEPSVLDSRLPSPKLLRLLEEIVHEDVRGRSRALWLESKSLELIALVSDHLDETPRAGAPLAGDLEALERARRRLVRRLDLPPSLEELARVAGFNVTKLKDGFRARYGVPVFAYLRQRRMEEARRLLLEGRANVTEAALRVGYTNPSKFAAAFRRQFGVRPSSL